MYTFLIDIYIQLTGNGGKKLRKNINRKQKSPREKDPCNIKK